MGIVLLILIFILNTPLSRLCRHPYPSAHLITSKMADCRTERCKPLKSRAQKPKGAIFYMLRGWPLSLCEWFKKFFYFLNPEVPNFKTLSISSARELLKECKEEFKLPSNFVL